MAPAPIRIDRRDSGAAHDDTFDASVGDFRYSPIGYQRIDRRSRYDVRKMLGPQIGGAKNKSVRNSIKFDKRQGRRKLIPGQRLRLSDHGVPRADY